jgi:hypothetical protein
VLREDVRHALNVSWKSWVRMLVVATRIISVADWQHFDKLQCVPLREAYLQLWVAHLLVVVYPDVRCLLRE